MARRETARRTTTAPPMRRFTQEEMLRQVAASDTRACVAVDGHGLLPPLMRCVGACPRCAELTAKYNAAAPERERARQEYEAANPIKAAEAAHQDGPHVPTDDFEADA
jgi:hypothetical protein